MRFISLSSRFFLILFLFLISSSVFAALSEGSMKIFAVLPDGSALDAELFLEVEQQGKGKVSTVISSLVGTSTQATAKTAVEVISTYFDDAFNYDYEFDIRSNASLVEGPSAGAAMTLLTYSLLAEKPLNPEVALTGTITQDGFVGQVGGVFAKAEEASKEGIKLFMIPQGESRQVQRIGDKIQTVNLPQYAFEKWNMKVIEVANIEDVIKYAYTPISEIDINAVNNGSLEIFEFVPEAVEGSLEITPMKDLTNKHIRTTKEQLASAKRSIESTNLEDRSILDLLLSLINSSEEALSKSEQLIERNYLYSSANFSFLARVNVEFVKDAAENPSIVSPNSTVLKLKIESLQESIAELREKLSEDIPLDKLEWFISAQQRLSYAEVTLEKIKSKQVLVVENGEIVESPLNQGDELSKTIEDLQQFEYAKAWYLVAVDLYEISQEGKKLISQEPLFSDSIDEFLVQSENGLSVMQESDREDVLRRLDSAKIEKLKGWNFSSLTDSASSLALINAEITIKNLEQKNNVNEIFSFLENKINETEKQINESEFDFVWPKLYLDHAKYFLKSAEFYRDKHQISAAKTNLTNGITLAFLAENVFLVTEEIHSYYAMNPSLIKGNLNPPLQSNLSQGSFLSASFSSLGPVSLLIVFFSVFIVVIISFVLFNFLYNSLPFSRSRTEIISQIKANKKLQEELDLKKSNESGASDLSSAKRSFNRNLEKLERNRKLKVRELLEIDRKRAELFSTNKLLRDLQFHLREGLLSEEEFKKESSKYRSRAKKIEKDLMNLKQN